MSLNPANLTREDLRTTAWDHLIADMQARLQTLREENDSFSDDMTTAKRRGRIAEVKDWLDLAKQAQRSDGSPQGLPSSRPHWATELKSTP